MKVYTDSLFANGCRPSIIVSSVPLPHRHYATAAAAAAAVFETQALVLV